MAADLGLWTRFVDDPQSENFLFTERDIRRPNDSMLWQALLKSPDPDVRIWTSALLESIDKPFDAIPRFEIDDFKALRKAVQTRDWERIYSETMGSRNWTRQFPSDLAAAINEARKRIACRDRLVQALRARDLGATRPRMIPGCSMTGSQRARW